MKYLYWVHQVKGYSFRTMEWHCDREWLVAQGWQTVSYKDFVAFRKAGKQ